MLLALLMLVVGLEGGPLAIPATLLLDTVRFIRGGARPLVSLASNVCVGMLKTGILDPELCLLGGPLGGPPLAGGGVGLADGGPVPLMLLGGPAFGGGGVPALATSSLPAFLFTHFFKSGS